MIPLLLACGASVLPAPTAGPAGLRLRVAEAKVAEGQPIELSVEVSLADGWTLQPGAITAEGLKAEETDTDGPSLVGDHTRSVHHYTLSGPNGSYVIDMGPVTATGPSGQTEDIDPEPIFVDIGVKGPSGGPMADFAEVPPPAEFPWALAAIAGGVAGLVALVLVLWRRRPVPVVPPDPPDVVALRAWQQARAAGLDDHALALELSRVFREYLSAITSWPATARTTREILDHLEGERRIGPALRLRSARVLDATDRLKFAREGGGMAFFDELETDFHAVVQATRPTVELPGA